MNSSLGDVTAGKEAAAVSLGLAASRDQPQAVQHSLRQIRQVEPADISAQLGQPLAINFYARGHSPLEGLVPAPRTPVPPGWLERDTWLTEKCREPAYLEEFSRLLEERSALEARGGEFCFPPLKTTLRNMCRFIDYIGAGKQFDDQLTEKEHQALAWIREKACELETINAPYQRTVYLSLALMSLCEVITDRQVLGPLEKARPEAFKHIFKVTGWSSSLAQEAYEALPVRLSGAAIDPLKLVALNWGGNNPGGKAQPFDSMTCSPLMYVLWERLPAQLRMPHLLLYPSFEDLDIADFCRFGHLGVHPLGLTTHYGCNADGVIRSPLEFAHHDMVHAGQLEDVGDPARASEEEPGAVLTRRDRRLGWRCLLLDQLPARLGHLEPALDLFLFQLMHERWADKAVTRYLEDGENPFVRCLGRMACARRQERNGYIKRYQAITDREAAMAVLWSLRLWRSWQAADYRPLAQDRLEAFAQEFVARDLPRLQEHLAFVDQHRPALRQWFADCFGSATTPDGHFGVKMNLALARLVDCEGLFLSFHRDSGLSHLDYTDIGYFFALHSSELCQQMTDSLATALPSRDLFRLAPFGCALGDLAMDSKNPDASRAASQDIYDFHPEECPQ